ncbi:hypothetical protein JQN58_00040 [Aneurinibacillus sp. BA2021]|nr:hypothetical protein [Aneurinibacillus sp. BA2021]
MWSAFVFFVLCFTPHSVFAAGETEQVAQSVDYVWIILSAILVILMQPGFAMLEAGSTRMKNAGHVAGKTVFAFGLCSLIFWLVGFGITFGEGNALIGLSGFLLHGMKEVAGVVIGAIAGMLTYAASLFIERKGIDDPIYAGSVHGVAGIWGTLANGFFASPRFVETVGVGQPGLFYGGGFHQLGVQAIGVLACLVYVAVVSYVLIAGMKATIGIRVSEEEEILRLDVSEHGAYGYPEHLQENSLPSRSFPMSSAPLKNSV